MSRWGKQNEKPRQQLPPPTDATTEHTCSRCEQETPWSDFAFKKHKRTGDLYRTSVCRACTVRLGRVRTARLQIRRSDDDLFEAIMRLDRAALSDSD